MEWEVILRHKNTNDNWYLCRPDSLDAKEWNHERELLWIKKKKVIKREVNQQENNDEQYIDKNGKAESTTW